MSPFSPWCNTPGASNLANLGILWLSHIEYQSSSTFCTNVPIFYDRMNARLITQLDSVNRFYQNHFRVRWDIDADFYHEAIDRSMTYLAHILESDAENYKSHLRRALKIPG